MQKILMFDSKLRQKLLTIPILLMIVQAQGQVMPGAWQMEEYLPLLNDKNVALICNHTSMIGNSHLADSLIALQVNLVKLFSPEHGIRGNVSDGQKIDNGTDPETGLPVISLYGSHRKPTPEDLDSIDIVIFDIQDVGVRFYTYISTMHLVMEACGEQGVEMVILDRPNPNGHYVDGPVREADYESFVGMHPIPIIHGCTVGELACMIIGEKWIASAPKMSVINVKNYDHNTHYTLPVSPSPNLPNMQAISLYPSLALFEGTKVSVGRGTPHPFTCYGYPEEQLGDFTFTPVSTPGKSVNPPLKDRKCYGVDLSNSPYTSFTLSYLLHAFEVLGEDIFNAYFEKLAGTDMLRKQIVAGLPEDEIRLTWQESLNRYMRIRENYLLYD